MKLLYAFYGTTELELELTCSRRILQEQHVSNPNLGNNNNIIEEPDSQTARTDLNRSQLENTQKKS